MENFFLFVESKEFFSIKSFTLFLKALKKDYTVNFESLEIESNYMLLKKIVSRYHQMVVGGKKNKDVQWIEEITKLYSITCLMSMEYSIDTNISSFVEF